MPESHEIWAHVELTDEEREDLKKQVEAALNGIDEERSRVVSVSRSGFPVIVTNYPVTWERKES